MKKSKTKIGILLTTLVLSAGVISFGASYEVNKDQFNKVRAKENADVKTLTLDKTKFHNMCPSSYGYYKASSIYVGKYSDYSTQVAGLTEVDISESESGGHIKAYYNSESDVCYIVYKLQGEETEYQNILFPTDSSSLFSKYSSVTKFSFSNIDTSSVTNMSSMFSYCSGLTGLDLGSFNTSNVTDMSSMFHGCSRIKHLVVTNFNTSNVTNMSSMFNNFNSDGLGEGYSTKLNLANFDTSSVTNMSNMFFYSGIEELFIDNFDTSNVTNVSYMFENSQQLTTIHVKKDFVFKSEVTDTNMFSDCYGLKGGNGTQYWGTYVKDKSYAKIDKEGTPGYFTQSAETPLFTLNSIGGYIKKGDTKQQIIAFCFTFSDYASLPAETEQFGIMIYSRTSKSEYGFIKRYNCKKFDDLKKNEGRFYCVFGDDDEEKIVDNQIYYAKGFVQAGTVYSYSLLTTAAGNYDTEYKL